MMETLEDIISTHVAASIETLMRPNCPPYGQQASLLFHPLLLPSRALLRQEVCGSMSVAWTIEPPQMDSRQLILMNLSPMWFFGMTVTIRHARMEHGRYFLQWIALRYVHEWHRVCFGSSITLLHYASCRQPFHTSSTAPFLPVSLVSGAL